MNSGEALGSERINDSVNLPSLMLRERGQNPKGYVCRILFIRHSGRGKIMGTKNRSGVGRGEEGHFGGVDGNSLSLDCTPEKVNFVLWQ